jgi:hypothetical protein
VAVHRLAVLRIALLEDRRLAVMIAFASKFFTKVTSASSDASCPWSVAIFTLPLNTQWLSSKFKFVDWPFACA